MRKIRRHQAWGIGAAALLGAGAAQAQDPSYYYPPYVPPSQSSVYNQNSMYLPTPPSVNGQDMVRGAGGVTCQSAVASGGPYVDIGLIGAQDVFNRDTAAVYGRVVLPLGKRPDRPDCTKLYEMELARMQMELDLMRMGLPDFGGPPPAPEPLSDAEQGGAPAVIAPPETAEAPEAEETPAPAPPDLAPPPSLKPVAGSEKKTFLSQLRP
jgi:hypothetical protein